MNTETSVMSKEQFCFSSKKVNEPSGGDKIDNKLRQKVLMKIKFTNAFVKKPQCID